MNPRTMNPRAVGFARAARLLYVHNPLYLISALVFLYGVRLSFSGDAAVTGGWTLLVILCGYALLLAAAGWAIIRFGQVWDDARTILLLIVLMFVALAVSFDELLLKNVAAGGRFLLCGFLFCVLLTEVVLRSLTIRLPWIYRGPYYVLLLVLFAYPLWLAQLSTIGKDAQMTWGVFLFPWVGAAAMLTLLPAARADPTTAAPSGTPWSWPLYPWSLFAMLGLSLGLRSYSLSVAFEASQALYASFRPYFLFPLGMAASILAIELSRTARAPKAVAAALLIPLAYVLFAFPGHGDNPVEARFLAMLCARAGSPAQIMAYGLLVFYAIQWARGLQLAELGLIAALALLSVVDRHTLDSQSFTNPQALPLVALAAFELVLCLVRRSSWRALVAGFAAAALFSGYGTVRPSPQAAGVVFTAPGQVGLYFAHAAFLAMVLVTVVFDDRWAILARRAAGVLMAVSAVLAASVYPWILPDVPQGITLIYLMCLVALQCACWYRNRSPVQLVVTLLTATAFLGAALRETYALVERTAQLERGLPWIAAGIALLLVAVCISLIKAGIFARLWLRALRASLPREA